MTFRLIIKIKQEAVHERHAPEAAAEDSSTHGHNAYDVTPSHGEPVTTADNWLSFATADLNNIDSKQNCAQPDNTDVMNYESSKSVCSPLSARRREERQPQTPTSYKLTTSGTLVECTTSAINSVIAEHQTGQSDWKLFIE